ncbi:histidine kinase [Saccharomonospora piscinae]|uniref:histidine kinase n=1 Tax=Saccharomonospora piscinae TaxID=687388 RepID=A0A1V9A165_SACPI|nr:sensor histidine kinase [Saccharomonospora piscinae]OQO90902.1 histidine kinase [Saccharomonospora piscinae]TLW93593.1 HAMP domain-containing protein [Saccharomonospora piscinae]
MSALLNKSAATERGRSTIRTRVLAIAFIPSVVFLLTGVALAGYLVYDAVQVRTFATKVHDAAQPAGVLFANVREERRLTLQELSNTRSLRAELDQQRQRTDEAAQRMAGDLESISEDAPENVRESITASMRQVSRLGEFRGQVDAGDASLQQAYDFYNGIIDSYTVGLNGVAQETPSAETAYQRMVAMPLFVSADGMSRGDALAAAGLAGGGLTEQEFRTYIGQVGAYHATLEQAVPDMIPSVRAQYEDLVASEAWQTLTAAENAFLRGNTTDLPVAETEWRAAATEVSGVLWNLYVEQSTVATELALDEADSTLLTSIVAGVAVIAVALAVLLLAWRLSDRLVKRLVSLREATLEVAEERMPRIVQRLRGGEQVDLATEVSYLDHGDDEIGQVAEAFNQAQRTAIAAAVDEAKTREGTQRVFLNIAHRSQVIVHRQLSALDAAERKQEDPDQLDLLFRLDHLSTRARRNAENLIILGGEQPGRQFRNPVPVTDIVRGAIAETEDYTRVSMGRLPSSAVAGPAVGDLVHLLAELIDNATSFSPPQSRVEVRGELVGRGVVIEIEDQGIGMEPEELERLSEMLRNPPDFSFMALSEEPRLGLFVVARLAAKHGFTVTLRESAYGGTRAIVLVRADLLSELDDGEDTPAGDAAAPSAAPGVEQAPAAISRRPRALPRRNGSERVNGTSPTEASPTASATAPPATPEPGAPTVRRAPVTPQAPQAPQFPQAEPGRPELPRRHQRGDGAEESGRSESVGGVQGQLPADVTRDDPPPPQGRERQGRHADPGGRSASAELSGLEQGLPPESAEPTQYVPKLPRELPRAARPGPDTRPRHQARSAPEPQAGDGQAPPAAGSMDADRPPLPRRRRQQNLAPQLKEETTSTDLTVSGQDGGEPDTTPEQARSRLSAFQQGTRRARQHPTGRDDSGD